MSVSRLYDFLSMGEELDHIRQLVRQHSTAGVFPLINATEDKNNFYVRAELPGLKVEDIEIMATGKGIAISGERKISSEGKDVKYHRREREAGKFSRMLNLPMHIDSAKVEAKLLDGILSVVLPKTESGKPRQIVVK